MAWATPPTFSSGAVLTAAQLNILSNNHLECGAATVTTAGDIVVADGANSMGTRLAIGSANDILVSDGSVPVWRSTDVSTDTSSNTTTSTSYTDLWSPSSVSVTVTTGTKALIHISSLLSNNTAGGVTYMSFSISGATSANASDTKAIRAESNAANDQYQMGSTFYTTLTGGSNTFTLEGKVSTGTGTFTNARIVVEGR